MSPWLGFWERANRIYVSDRHRTAHYRQVADDILSIPTLRPDSAVLDYGCGAALEAARVAERVGRLYLHDAAARVREGLRARFAAVSRVAVLDEAGLEALTPGALDLIVVNSVLQYVPREALPELLRRWRGWLKPGGLLVLADVVPPGAGGLADLTALLATAWRHGFLPAAFVGLAATFFSDYRRLRARNGLTEYGEAELLQLLAEAGYGARRRPENFGFNRARMTFLAERTGGDPGRTSG
jgi:SAM-dependent methyltransferase